MFEDVINDENCNRIQRIVSKFGYTILCDDDEVENAIVVAENCDSVEKVVSQYGYTVICDDQDEDEE